LEAHRSTESRPPAAPASKENQASRELNQSRYWQLPSAGGSGEGLMIAVLTEFTPSCAGKAVEHSSPGRGQPAEGPGWAGHASQASPKPSASASACAGFGTDGQLSVASGTPSPSASGEVPEFTPWSVTVPVQVPEVPETP